MKLIIGRYKYNVEIIPGEKHNKPGRLFLKFPYNKALMSEIKACLSQPTWHGFDDKPLKIWSVKDDRRTQFQLQYLQGLNPYARFDVEIPEYTSSNRPLYKHQRDLVAQGLATHYCIWAAEMGTGKSLSAIEVMEKSGYEDHECWYVGPKSGVVAFDRELNKWGSAVRPQMMTYERLVKVMKYWPDGKPAPKLVIYDESSKIKNPTAQRTQAAAALAVAIMKEWGDDGYVILMSGSPAPQSPTDWWSQTEIAWPGFLRENSPGTLRNRLAIIEQRESALTGGIYPHLVSWLDDENKCAICGKTKNEHAIGPAFLTGEVNSHEYKKAVNEVAYLYKRMKGLVQVKLKKDCVDLPEIQYERIRLKPTVAMLQVAKAIKDTSSRAIMALTLLRELSDGFQYQDIEAGTKECPTCSGGCQIQDPEQPYGTMMTCPHCNGDGHVARFERGVNTVGSPKDAEYINDLEIAEELGRYTVWGGFTGTIDRLVDIAHQHGWATLRVDGRGYHGALPTGEILDSKILLDAMDRSHPNYKELLNRIPKLCFVGHPQAGGMALTLTASPVEMFYSNCFNGDARIQAIHRGHRLGMDENRGLVIKDLIVLPTDELVLTNLERKSDLQKLTMGDLSKVLEQGVYDETRSV